jgi:hypothetical protein
VTQGDENVVVFAAFLLALTLFLLGNDESAAIVAVGASIFGLVGYIVRTRRETRERKAQRDLVIEYRRHGSPLMADEEFGMLVLWQCGDHPGHRGWRFPGDPIGTCDYCLGMTSFEHEVVTAGRTYTPTHPEGLT